MEREREELVLKNQKLVYYFVKKLGHTSTDYEDLAQIGMIGLIKAANSFDFSKDIKFATYASRCIKNEIFMYFRRENKIFNVSSLEELLLFGDRTEDSIRLIDCIEDDKGLSIEENFECINTYEKVINIILNAFSSREIYILLNLLSEMGKAEIANKVNISQSYVSRLQKKLYSRVKKYFYENKQYEEAISMTVEENSYRITFLSQDVNTFNLAFAKWLTSRTEVESIPDFRLTCEDNRIFLKMPSDVSSLQFIAEVIKVVSDYTFSFEADKTKVNVEEQRKSKIIAVQENDDEDDDNIPEEEAESYEPEIVQEESYEICEQEGVPNKKQTFQGNQRKTG